MYSGNNAPPQVTYWDGKAGGRGGGVTFLGLGSIDAEINENITLMRNSIFFLYSGYSFPE